MLKRSLRPRQIPLSTMQNGICEVTALICNDNVQIRFTDSMNVSMLQAECSTQNVSLSLFSAAWIEHDRKFQQIGVYKNLTWDMENTVYPSEKDTFNGQMFRIGILPVSSFDNFQVFCIIGKT